MFFTRSCLFFLIAFALQLAAQQYLVKSFSKQDGMMHLQIFDIDQDKNGYIWLATGGGLSRYDGIEFKNFTTKDGLPGSEFYTQHIDKENRLWIYGYEGLSFIDLNTPSVLTPKLFKETARPYSAFSLLSIDKTVLIGTRQNGLQVFADGKLYKHPVSLNSKGILKELEQDENGNVWGMFIDNSLFKLDKNLNIQKIYADKRFSDIQHFKLISATKIALVARQALYEFDTSTEKVTLKRDFKKRFPNLSLYHLKKSADGFILSSNQGLIFVTGNGDIVLRKENGLKTEYISLTFSDKQNNLWIGSDSNGLSMLYNRGILLYDDKAGLRNSAVNSMIIDDGEIIFGTDRGIQRLSKGGKIVSDRRFDAVKNYAIWVIKKIGSEIWIGTDTHVFVYSKATEKVRKIEGLPISTFVEIAEEQNGSVFICSMNGLYVYDNGKMSFPEHLNQLAGQNVWTVLKQDNKYILGTQKGVLEYSAQSGEVKLLTEEEQNVYSIISAKNGGFYIGNDNGLFHLTADTLINLSLSKGIDFGVISTVQKHSDGNYWVAHQHGIDLFDGEKVLHSFDGRSGPIAPEVTTGTAFAFLKNKTYFGLFQGLLVVPNRQITTENHQPTTILTKHEFRDQSGKKFSTTENNIRLRHTTNSVEFEFVSPWFVNSHTLRYQYRLKGQNESWSEFSQLRSVYFSSLSAGDYSFEVRAQTSSQTVGEPVSFSFTIEKPFWKEWWFYFVSALLSISTILFSIKQYTKAIKQRNLELEQKILLRTRDLQQAKDDIEHIIEFSAISILTVDTENAITFCNRQLEALFDCERGSLVGEKVSVLDSESDSDSFKDIILAATEENTYVEATKHTSHGHEIPVYISCLRLQDLNGVFSGYTLIINDLREQYELHSRREEQQMFMTRIQVLNQILGTMSHFINNSAASILNMVELNETTGKFDKELKYFTKEHTTRIAQVVLSLRKLVQNLNLKTKKYIDGESEIFDIDADLAEFGKQLEQDQKGKLQKM